MQQNWRVLRLPIGPRAASGGARHCQMVQASGRMGERSVQPKEVGNRGCTGGKEEREGTAQDEGGTVGVLIAPKAARRQDRRLGPIRPGESKPETEFPATTLRVRCGNPAHIPLLPKMEEPPTYQPNQ
jgi:hypothetical protein